jgi:hypothetical protein
MQKVAPEMFSSGLLPLDKLLQGLRLGDNLVWQVDQLEDYPYFARAFVTQSIRDGLDCIYLRFAPQPAILDPCSGLTTKKIDPTLGFDYFSSEVHRIIEECGRKSCFVFDNISSLVKEWATDELLANFFQVTCPYLFELGHLAYFALRRGQHGHSTINRIRNTTQILVDVYHVAGNTYIHPLKVWNRYSTQMFLPHLLSNEGLEPVSHSGDAAMLLTAARLLPVEIKSQSIAPWDVVYRNIMQYQESETDFSEETEEAKTLKGKFCQMIFGNHPKLNRLADHYLTLDDLLQVRGRLIGSGRIGGKAAGMLIARRVLVTDKGETDFAQGLEEHDSFYIGSDVFFTFLVSNNLFQIRLELSKKGTLSWDDFAEVESRFLAGKFSEEIMEQFRKIIDYYGQAPIIVRSSSLLEDGFTDAFAGKYRSEFCTNQGSPEDRLEAFIRAVKLVYASALNPDAISYRHKRGFGEGEEQMAILIQRVSGMPYKHYFFPILAGVAFSHNLYAWTGMGIAKYSQRLVDVLNLKTNTFEVKPFVEIIEGNKYPVLHLLTSEIADGYLRDWISTPLTSSGRNLILTFNNLINQTKMVKVIEEILTKLERAWDQPIDIEFTAYVDDARRIKVNLLQCRSLRVHRSAGTEIRIPKNLPKEQVLFRSNQAISAGVVSNIRYIVYVDPQKYDEVATYEEKKMLGRVIGKLNNHLRNKEGMVMAMGPGRWGSSNNELGVNVSYSDIDDIAVLVEVAHEKAGHVPEVSYGTHFFQDLVEAEILYLPVYPDDTTTDFNTKFFTDSPNILEDILPELSSFKEVVQVIDVKAAASSATAKVIGDPRTRRAICFLENN